MTRHVRYPVQHLAARMRIDCGNAWTEPTADYWCARCDQTESAQGAAAVLAFVESIRAQHATRCTPTSPER